MDKMIVQGEISSKILTLRGQNVMLDRDLAKLYQVENRVLNQAVKRNIDRFPDDFMFQLNKEEFENLKSQIVISSSVHGGIRKMPYAFTEEGIYMLATVLNSKVAVQTNIAIIRTFKKLREFSKHYNTLAKQIMAVERKSDKQYGELKKALDELVESSRVVDEKVMGFLK
ncbi:MAG: ORF6N domain-containing protein [Sulfurovum sp.]|nr:ORF6N domain-containing protein [Sulfurovum sp.]